MQSKLQGATFYIPTARKPVHVPMESKSSMLVLDAEQDRH